MSNRNRKKIEVEAEPLGIPFCYDPLAKAVGRVIGADALPEMLARFGCIANCENCLVKEGVEAGLDTVTDVISDVGVGVVKMVSRLHTFARGGEKIG